MYKRSNKREYYDFYNEIPVKPVVNTYLLEVY